MKKTIIYKYIYIYIYIYIPYIHIFMTRNCYIIQRILNFNVVTFLGRLSLPFRIGQIAKSRCILYIVKSWCIFRELISYLANHGDLELKDHLSEAAGETGEKWDIYKYLCELTLEPQWGLHLHTPHKDSHYCAYHVAPPCYIPGSASACQPGKSIEYLKQNCAGVTAKYKFPMIILNDKRS